MSFGTLDLDREVRRKILENGHEISVRDAKRLVRLVLETAVDGLFTDGSLVLPELGSFYIIENDPRETGVYYDRCLSHRIRYKQTLAVRRRLSGLQSRGRVCP